MSENLPHTTELEQSQNPEVGNLELSQALRLGGEPKEFQAGGRLVLTKQEVPDNQAEISGVEAAGPQDSDLEIIDISTLEISENGNPVYDGSEIQPGVRYLIVRPGQGLEGGFKGIHEEGEVTPTQLKKRFGVDWPVTISVNPKTGGLLVSADETAEPISMFRFGEAPDYGESSDNDDVEGDSLELDELNAEADHLNAELEQSEEITPKSVEEELGEVALDVVDIEEPDGPDELVDKDSVEKFKRDYKNKIALGFNNLSENLPSMLNKSDGLSNEIDNGVAITKRQLEELSGMLGNVNRVLLNGGSVSEVRGALEEISERLGMVPRSLSYIGENIHSMRLESIKSVSDLINTTADYVKAQTGSAADYAANELLDIDVANEISSDKSISTGLYESAEVIESLDLELKRKESGLEDYHYAVVNANAIIYDLKYGIAAGTVSPDELISTLSSLKSRFEGINEGDGINSGLSFYRIGDSFRASYDELIGNLNKLQTEIE